MKQKRKISFKISILQTFFALLILTEVSITLLFYLGSTNIIFDLSEKLTKELTEKIIERSTNFISAPALQTKPISKLVTNTNIVAIHEEMSKIMWEQLLIHPQVQSIFLADKNGSYVQVRREPDYATRVIDRSGEHPPTETWFYRDLDYKITRTETNTPTFDPRVRPWYKNTKNEQKIYWTDVYVFTTAQTPGFSATYPVLDEEGNVAVVVCLNSPLHSLSEFLGEQKVGQHGLVFIVNEKDEIMAYPDSKMTVHKDAATGKLRLTKVEDLNEPWIRDAYKKYKTTGSTKLETRTEGKDYLTNVAPFPKSFASKWQVVVIVPEDDLLGSVNELLYQALLIAVIIFFVSSVAVIIFANYITRPIAKLSLATSQVKHLDLDKISFVDSRIREIDEMNTSLMSTTQGLQSFAKYVPKTLVRQLIELGQEAQLGGEETDLTIFFSDIKGFTSISEGMIPKDLVMHLSEYLEELSNIIMEDKGTIDKYIGDAIMAFWGAPTKQPNSHYRACRAALHCQKKLDELNKKWREAGKPIMETRIGIHTGKTIVGNFGSPDRMNYTIIGDSVNLASRLEGMNKHYDTQIIISEDTYRRVADRFVCRTLDIVAVKGKTKGIKIYELVAEKNETISEEIKRFCSDFELGVEAYLQKDWDNALTIFSGLSSQFPNDMSVELFIQRCNDFKANPQQLPHNWDGTIIFNTK